MNQTKINLNTLALALAFTCGVSAFASAVSDRHGEAVYQDDWRKERDQFRTDVNKRIDKNKKDIQSLKDEGKNKKEPGRKKYDDAIANLEKKNDRLRSKLADYKDDSKDNWQSFKREFNHDMDELGTAINDLFKDNKK